MPQIFAITPDDIKRLNDIQMTDLCNIEPSGEPGFP